MVANNVDLILADLEEEETIVVDAIPEKRRPSWVKWSVVVVMCLEALAAGWGIYWFLVPSSVTVTLVPEVRQVSAPVTVSGRQLSTVLSQARTVPTTGRRHQTATFARGSVTFYNSALTPQTVAAGTLLGGVIVTDQDATIPAGELSVNGKMTVPAHAVTVGPEGNVAAGYVYGPCCRLGVYAASGKFSGGQVSRDFRSVSQQDVDAATVRGDSTGVFQIGEGETLSETVCAPTATPSKAVGEEAEQVTVTTDNHCTATAYPTQRLRDILSTPGYEISLSVSVIGSEVRGKAVKKFSGEELAALSRRVAGKKSDQAKAILLSSPGVKSVSLPSNLPADPKAVKFLIIQ